MDLNEESPGNRPLAVIIGMPGAGKTRVGREGAHMLGVDFVDSDIEIEKRAGMPIPRYFERYGESGFRDLEADVIAELLACCTGLLALGGGAPMTASTRALLEDYVNDGGRLVYLQADMREAMERANKAGGRPMLDGNSNVRWRRLYAQRDPVFRRISNFNVHTHGSTPRMAARKLVNMIRQRVVHVTGDGIEPYSVHIGRGTLGGLQDALGRDVLRVALIHTTVVQRHSDQVRAILRRAGYRVYDVVIPDAETGKSIAVADKVWHRLGSEGFTRSDAVVGVGGGAATDLAGFIASTWMRGIRYVNCPTSLLAMVDASTGGKTGINTVDGKNLVGTFYTPAGVLADIKTLSTLPNDIFVEGLGEVVKSGFIKDTAMLDVLDANSASLKGFDGAAFLDTVLEEVVCELIERTVRVKAYHVSADLREAGLREYLNYGHTLAHAIEKIEGFRWRHGNAVAVGCVFAAELSHLLGYIDQGLVDRHRRLFAQLGLPVSWDGAGFDDVLALMHRDKKARGDSLRFVLLKTLGEPVIVEDPPLDAVEEAFRRIRP